MCAATPANAAALPFTQAGRAEIRRAEQVVQRLGDPVLGDQLLGVEVDRRRSDPLAVLGRRSDARGKLGFRLEAAGRAAIDRGLVFGDLDQLLGQIEHLPLLRPRLHRRGERGAATKADARRMPLDPVGRLDLFERVALVPGLPAALLAGAPAKAAGNARLLLQPVARRRLGAVRAVQAHSSPKLGHLGPKGNVVSLQRLVLVPQRRVLAPQNPVLGPRRLVPALQPSDFAAQLRNVAYERVDRVANRSGAENHLHLDSCFRPTRLALSTRPPIFHANCCKSDSPTLGVTSRL